MVFSTSTFGRPVRATDLEPLLQELNAISRQAEDIQHRISMLQAGIPLPRPGWPLRPWSRPEAEPRGDPEAGEAEDLSPGRRSAAGAGDSPVVEGWPPPERERLLTTGSGAPAAPLPVTGGQLPWWPGEEAAEPSDGEGAGPEVPEDPLLQILRLADGLSHRSAAGPSAAEAQIRAIRERIALSRGWSGDH